MIGEAFDEFSDDVCGAVMNIRPKGDKIGIWTGDGNRSTSIIEIGFVQFCNFFFKFGLSIYGYPKFNMCKNHTFCFLLTDIYTSFEIIFLTVCY